MSKWTHVNASIRYDGIFNMGTPTTEELGKIYRWGDDGDWDTIVPCGSEGSIEYNIIKNPDPHSMTSMVVVFYGDLRDYNNADEILEYFTKITKDKFIRSGILEIDIEFENTLIYRYNSETEKWEKT